jgi:hypothetical protein
MALFLAILSGIAYNKTETYRSSERLERQNEVLATQNGIVVEALFYDHLF